MQKLLTLPIKFYRLFISPVLPCSCRFTPTCSEYALEAVNEYGMRGLVMAIKRIIRCHPWGGDGFDPVIKSELSREK